MCAEKREQKCSDLDRSESGGISEDILHLIKELKMKWINEKKIMKRMEV